MTAEAGSGNVPICCVADGSHSLANLQNVDGAGKQNTAAKSARARRGARGTDFGAVQKTQRRMENTTTHTTAKVPPAQRQQMHQAMLLMQQQ